MAVPVIETTATATALATTTVTITKPTGLAVGDVLLVSLGAGDISGGNGTWSTPAGWTSVRSGSSTVLSAVPAVFYIVATSTEVSASNFTFTISASTTSLSGCLMRITGHNPSNPIDISELDQTATGATALTSTTALTPLTTNNLLIFSYVASGNNFALTTPTITGYASTPASTWTEVADVGVKNASNDGHGLGIASSEYLSTTEITSRTATISETANSGYGSIALIVNGIVDATGTTALLEVSPTTFSQAGRGDTNATNALHEVSPTFFDQSGRATTPTVWTNEDKPSTTWTNESL